GDVLARQLTARARGRGRSEDGGPGLERPLGTRRYLTAVGAPEHHVPPEVGAGRVAGEGDMLGDDARLAGGTRGAAEDVAADAAADRRRGVAGGRAGGGAGPGAGRAGHQVPPPTGAPGVAGAGGVEGPPVARNPADRAGVAPHDGAGEGDQAGDPAG